MPARPTIALFNESLFNSYTRQVWSGVETRARDLGYRTVTLCGTLHHQVNRGVPLPEGLDDGRSNLLLECFDPQQFAGYVFWSAMLNHGASQSEVKDFVAQTRGRPVVSLGLEVPETLSVVGDNFEAMSSVVRHMIEVHGCRRLLYIAGNDATDQEEIAQRYRAYCQTLGDFHQALDERLVILPKELVPPPKEATEGEGYRPFFRYTPVGDRIAQIVFDERALVPGADFDGIVCRDDWTALEVLRAFERRQVPVGRGLPLMGFDDAPEGAVSSPSLSTVRQDLEDHAATACRYLVEQIEGRTPGAVHQLPPFPLVLRESCGCGAQTLQPTRDDQGQVDYPGLLESSMGVVSTFDIDKLLNQLPSQLQRVGVEGLYLVLFDDPNDPWSTATLHYGHTRGQPLQPHPAWKSFPVAQMLPPDCRELTQDLDLIVELLHFGNHRMGYVVFESGTAPGIAYYTVKSMLATALQGTLLIEENRRKLAEIEQKSQELDRAHARILLKEKQAALGSLVAGVAHEINTPLGIAVTSVSMVTDTVDTACLQRANGSWQPERLDALLAEVSEAGTLAMRGLVRADQLVKTFKQVAADQSHEVRRRFGLHLCLAEALRTIEHRWRNTAVVVELQGPEDLLLDSYEEPLGRLVSQLVLNALDHGFADGTPGKVLVQFEAQGSDRVVIRCIDDGRGIEAIHLQRLFDPFFTTRRSKGGTGLGLPMALNLASQVLGGDIEVDSDASGGRTCFTVTLPLRAPTLTTSR